MAVGDRRGVVDGEYLVARGDKPGETRLEKCPFCDTPLSSRAPGRRAADHLRNCEAFREAWGGDVGE